MDSSRYGDCLKKLILPCQIVCFLAGIQLFGAKPQLKKGVRCFLLGWKIFATFAAMFAIVGNLYLTVYLFVTGQVDFYAFSWQFVGFLGIYAHYPYVSLFCAKFAKQVDFLSASLNSRPFCMKRQTRCFMWSVQTIFWGSLAVQIYYFAIFHIELESRDHFCSELFPSQCGIDSLYLHAQDGIIYVMCQLIQITLYVFSFYLFIVTAVFSCHVADMAQQVGSVGLHYHNLRKYFSSFIRLSSWNLLMFFIYLVRRVSLLALPFSIDVNKQPIASAAVASFCGILLIFAAIHLDRTVSTRLFVEKRLLLKWNYSIYMKSRMLVHRQPDVKKEDFTTSRLYTVVSTIMETYKLRPQFLVVFQLSLAKTSRTSQTGNP